MVCISIFNIFGGISPVQWVRYVVCIRHNSNNYDNNNNNVTRFVHKYVSIQIAMIVFLCVCAEGIFYLKDLE